MSRVSESRRRSATDSFEATSFTKLTAEHSRRPRLSWSPSRQLRRGAGDSRGTSTRVAAGPAPARVDHSDFATHRRSGGAHHRWRGSRRLRGGTGQCRPPAGSGSDAASRTAAGPRGATTGAGSRGHATAGPRCATAAARACRGTAHPTPDAARPCGDAGRSAGGSRRSAGAAATAGARCCAATAGRAGAGPYGRSPGRGADPPCSPAAVRGVAEISGA